MGGSAANVEIQNPPYTFTIAITNTEKIRGTITVMYSVLYVKTVTGKKQSFVLKQNKNSFVSWRPSAYPMKECVS